MPADPYGSSLTALLALDLRDRLAGRTARANARWGLLNPPAPGGKLVWIAAGAARASVRLAVELARALREKRLDLRLAVTVEENYPDLLSALEGLAMTGWGYAPCDRLGAARRALERLRPMGMIFAGRAPRPNLALHLSAIRHRLLVGAPPPAGIAFEHVYPAAEDQARSGGGPSAPVAALLTLVMPAQVDPNFTSMAAGGAARRMWWWHGDADRLARFLRPFRAAFGEDLLFVSGAAAAGTDATARLAGWNREPLPAAATVAVDAPEWLPAIAAACSGVHFDRRDDAALWQALAGGAAASVTAGVALPKAALAGVVEQYEGEAALAAWQRLAQSPAQARARRDASRRAFWDERRLAAAVLDELLARVFDWD